MVIDRSASLDRIFGALSDPTRRRILERLAAGEQTVMRLAGEFAISQPAVTKHLNVLADAGLISRRREGRQRICRLEPRALATPIDWIAGMRRLWNDRLDALEALFTDPAGKEGLPDAEP